MLLWPLSPFIVLAVSQLWIIVMVRTLKVLTAFDVANAIGDFCSLILLRPESPALKSTLPMVFNGIGVRDTTGVLQIGINTVIHTLKNSRRNE